LIETFKNLQQYFLERRERLFDGLERERLNAVCSGQPGTCSTEDHVAQLDGFHEEMHVWRRFV